MSKASRTTSGRRGRAAGMQLKLTSMIDVVFLLLIYFVVSSSFAVGEGVIEARMPQGPGTGAVEPEPQRIDVEVRSAGLAGYRLTVRNHPVSPRDFSDLASMLDRLRYDGPGDDGLHKPTDPVVIHCDQRVRWQHVVNAFNAAVAARYTNVRFETVR